MIRKILFIEI